MRIRWTAAIAAALMVAGCSGGGGEEETSTSTQSHYLSLGDSLTVGVQPDESGTQRETPEGYTDVLYRTLKDADSTLHHERMGCGGEDTTTFIEGGIAGCDTRYEQGSQLDEAVDFLEEHEGRVGLVTLTIGANNFTDCVEGLAPETGSRTELDIDDVGLDRDCVDDGLERLESEVPVIAERLTDAAGPQTQIVAMTYYNPFLALSLLEENEESGGDAEESEDVSEDLPEANADEVAEDAESGVAHGTVEIMEDVNDSLTATYQAAGIDVADVDEVFDGSNTTVPDDSDTGMPVNLQKVCDLTWMCNTVQGPDIHTNLAGAQEIAEVFRERVR